MAMTPRQVMMTADQHDRLRIMAGEHGVSMAEMIRRAVDSEWNRTNGTQEQKDRVQAQICLLYTSPSPRDS